jgi:hypothetical protein
MSVTKAAERFSEHRSAIDLEKQEMQTQSQSIGRGMSPDSDLVAQMLSRIETSLTLETVEKELVQTAADLSRGEAVYFRYQRRMQNLSVQIASQGSKMENHHLLQAYVRKDIELQVEQLSDAGKVASLTHYGPIKKIIQSSFQGARYEAWAVTSSPEISLQAKMVGVLVLINPDQTDAAFRPVLARVMRESGNYLYAHGNKIRSRNVPGPELMA